MSIDHKEISRSRALESYREAAVWWTAFEAAVNEWRTWVVYGITQKYLIERAAFRGSPSLNWMRRELDRAHDMRISARANIDAMARCASACESTARIYMEEYEQREWMNALEGNDGHGY